MSWEIFGTFSVIFSIVHVVLWRRYVKSKDPEISFSEAVKQYRHELWMPPVLFVLIPPALVTVLGVIVTIFENVI